MNYVYIIKCQDESYYTGITKDIKKRLKQHFYKEKQGAKYTKSRQALWLEALWETSGWSEAGRLEYFIKSLNRKEKEELVKNPSFLAEAYRKKKKKEPPEICISNCFAEFPVLLEEWFS
ncbi:MAG: GIY-YIG nuclease family protein [Roseburia sp.]|nr:GIY-YIG nuclease family protein [Roseburia sp.]MCM1279931.1 GIY-YIG nuclease family protein [Robinsoniella sp.]